MTRVTELEMDLNPVCRLSILRGFVAFAFPSIVSFNRSPVTDLDRDMGRLVFPGLCRLSGAGGRQQSGRGGESSSKQPPSQIGR